MSCLTFGSLQIQVSNKKDNPPFGGCKGPVGWFLYTAAEVPALLTGSVEEISHYICFISSFFFFFPFVFQPKARPWQLLLHELDKYGNNHKPPAGSVGSKMPLSFLNLFRGPQVCGVFLNLSAGQGISPKAMSVAVSPIAASISVSGLSRLLQTCEI